MRQDELPALARTTYFCLGQERPMIFQRSVSWTGTPTLPYLPLCVPGAQERSVDGEALTVPM